MTHGPLARLPRAGAALALAAALLACGGCAYTAPPPAPSITPPVVTPAPTRLVVEKEDVVYRTIGDVELSARACFAPDAPSPRPTLLLIHGGGFVAGSPSAMYALCEDAAAQGYAAFAIEYRLVPESTYPAQVEDAAAAVEWLRQPAQLDRYGVDPDHIGVLGSSAGAIIAASLGVDGEGPLTEGARVAAVAALSPVADMTDTGLTLGTAAPEAAATILAYLGCERAGTTACPASVPASPVTHVDASDAPMLLLAGESEIVPWQQPDALRARLESAGVAAELVVEPGASHGQQLLTPDNVARVFAFFEQHLRG
ncbi:alpha/beta hydrolase [Microbacterium sp. No. 7]|uniref:alpha/beta hydrolase n=1 Tax=Microbacterium sp. No. 7 TaxID=1714373 RepID=UPI0006CFAA3F|nr:alpha/beta hydrolase [Microbacterium sp. No. 7]ALJ19085.1 hypothetical protein AOA12_03865 [Microbacterium sp. No. 7]